jgi:hypothetical protein
MGDLAPFRRVVRCLTIKGDSEGSVIHDAERSDADQGGCEARLVLGRSLAASRASEVLGRLGSGRVALPWKRRVDNRCELGPTIVQTSLSGTQVVRPEWRISACLSPVARSSGDARASVNACPVLSMTSGSLRWPRLHLGRELYPVRGARACHATGR